MTANVSKTAEELLDDIAAELQVPESRYEAAERSYRSVGKWLERPESSLLSFRPVIYPQGSFRLGTAIKPANDEDHYDLDVVCELHVRKDSVTQAQLRTHLGTEVSAYAKAHGMQKPGESRRCWTLDYADEAQFHMDLLPALPDGARQRLLLESRNLDATWSATAIAITDKDHHAFRVRSEDWPSSNPKGYAGWFIGKMRAVFEARRAAVALQARAKAEDIPEYRVRTPLQQAIQILKRHRDITFVARADDRPISVILTTLAAQSYNQETTIPGALFSILSGMGRHVEQRNGIDWIPNPTDRRENFADRWVEHPQRRAAFYEWLEQARTDFSTAAAAHGAQQAIDALAPRLGRRLVEAAAGRRVARQRAASSVSRPIQEVASQIVSHLRGIMQAPHRKPPVWPDYGGGSVRIEDAIASRSGFRPQGFSSDGPALPKHASLQFNARTDVERPYKVFWQVTNTGTEAAAARGLRGDFHEGTVEAGKLTRTERTLYTGPHGIECFIVKDGLLVARSGLFVVNVG